MTPRGRGEGSGATIEPAARPPWMNDQEWAAFKEWDQAVAEHYGVTIEPPYDEAPFHD